MSVLYCDFASNIQTEHDLVLFDMTIRNCSHFKTTSEHLATTRQFAQALRVHEESIRRWLRSKRLKGLKIGHSWRISNQELDRIHKEGGV